VANAVPTELKIAVVAPVLWTKSERLSSNATRQRTISKPVANQAVKARSIPREPAVATKGAKRAHRSVKERMHVGNHLNPKEVKGDADRTALATLV